MARYHYCVRTDLGFPILVRFGDQDAEEFNRDGTWGKASSYVNEIRYGHGPFMHYDDITEEEAKKYMEIIMGNSPDHTEEA